MRDGIRASSMNIRTICSSSARCGWITLIATGRDTPAAPWRRPRYSVAIPPARTPDDLVLAEPVAGVERFELHRGTSSTLGSGVVILSVLTSV